MVKQELSETFFFDLTSTLLVDTNCRLSTGHPVCCSLWNSSFSDKNIIKKNHAKSSKCVTHTTYFPSSYEERQIRLAVKFDGIVDGSLRQEKIIKYVTSEFDLNESYIWMQRVRSRMENPLGFANGEFSLTDMQFLSRFNTTKICSNRKTEVFIEWIEPLSLHARNPFSLLNCRDSGIKKNSISNRKYRNLGTVTGLMNTDYILLQSAMYRRKDESSELKNEIKLESSARYRSKYYLFDAGTSNFASSLWWFICLYRQQHLNFDQIYGWELTLFEPNVFWREVPTPLQSKYHFYNVAIEPNITSKNSPIRMIKEIAKADDFVAFKLDIDTPHIEIPIALEILQNNDLLSLIDEFFFELHFRCEIMMSCGWGKNIPPSSYGMQLNRSSMMNFFQELRKRGVRSHIWP